MATVCNIDDVKAYLRVNGSSDIGYLKSGDAPHSAEMVLKGLRYRILEFLSGVNDDLPKVFQQVTVHLQDGYSFTAVPAYEPKYQRYLRNFWDVTMPVETVLGRTEVVVERVSRTRLAELVADRGDMMSAAAL